MRIAQIAPIIESVPPKKYGGIERVVYDLTEELVRKGHEVTLFATGDSKTSASLSSITNHSLREMNAREHICDLYSGNPLTLLHIGAAYNQQHNFDIIHDHAGFLSILAAQQSRTPVVMTMHGFLKPSIASLLRGMRRPYQVSISQSQRDPAPDLHYIGNVYNGLAMEDYPFSSTHDGYLLYVGRICEEKGTHLAILAARTAGIPLIIAAKLEPKDTSYFKKEVEPYLSQTIRWIGEVDEEERNRLYARAMCFIHPVTWAEPFGLTMIEAMACGAPVVALAKGSIPEIVVDGVSGYIAQNPVDLIASIKKVSQIDRRACREYALARFSARQMARGYEAIYEKILLREQTTHIRPKITTFSRSHTVSPSSVRLV